ncbi:MAG TPA: Npt1/Npt2 family nucleotide transporter [Candidatus Acidoferrales bacterium]|nr:Npt1/Npt2 family nucleotide transporter [Candidatus Acidoferrales bacterium]
MLNRIERLLNLRPGDFGRGALLFFYLFLVMACNVVGKVARAALFLNRFSATQLPFADISVAVVVVFVAAAYLRTSRRLSLRNLLAGSALFFASNCVFFWWMAHFHRPAWLYPVFYIWVGAYGVIAPMQVWKLANYVLTTREAKRLFGFVGSGAICGWVFAGYISKLVARGLGTEALLLGMAMSLIICAGLVFFITDQRRAAAGESVESEHPRGKSSLSESLRLVLSSNYLRAIALMICASSFVVTVTGWQFLAIAAKAIPEKNAMAMFLGDVSFYTGLFGILAQLLLTSWFLRRFGIGPALLVLPAVVLAGSTGLLIWGTLAAAVCLKASDQVLRYSVDKSGMELLYLPLPSKVKFPAKSFIDTVPLRLGDGLAGLTVLLFATYLHWSPQRLSWVVLVLVAGWGCAVWSARGLYVDTLREGIREHRMDAERASAAVLDRSTTNILADNLSASDPKEILYALSLLQVGRQASMHPAVYGLLSHPAPEVKQKAISILSAAGDLSARAQIEELLTDPDLNVRNEALVYLTHHAHVDPLAKIQEWNDLPDISLRAAMAAFLARPGPAQNLETAGLVLDGMVQESGPEGKPARIAAARLLAGLPEEFNAQLLWLIGDEDPEVAREAIRAVGAIRASWLLPAVLERMSSPEFAQAGAETLTQFGEEVVETLAEFVRDARVRVSAKLEIPVALAGIGTQAAATVLMDILLETDTALRQRIIAALNSIHQRHPELQLDRDMIEIVLLAEITGHLRSYQILGILGVSLKSDDTVVRALRESMNQEVERVFRLLRLMFPQYDFHSAYFGLQSANRTVHDNALEFLDNILKPQFRTLLVPLLDNYVSNQERVALANKTVGLKVENREEAVAALVGSEDPWLKSCGVYAVGMLGIMSLEPELDKCLTHPDALLREAARQAKLRLAARADVTGEAAANAASGAP